MICCEGKVMTNYLLFWETKDAANFAEQKLSQRAKELWKLYCIPADDPAGFTLANPIDAEIFCDEDRSEERKQVLRRISLEIGHTEEWRLLIFLMRDIDVLDDHVSLVEFLSALMDYDSPKRRHPIEENFLTCPQPESIWLITLYNEPTRAVPSFPPSRRPDERRYSAYPPNCRFLRFKLDFHLQNSFSIRMLELHCGIRSLARNVLPAEVLRGNCVYQMGVDLDMAMFHETVMEYDQWLDHVEQAIRDEEVRVPADWLLPESAPAMNPIPEFHKNVGEQITLNHNEPEAQLVLLEGTVSQELEKDSIEEGRRLRDEEERLRRWAERQPWGTMTKGMEDEWKREMNELEEHMLQSHVAEDTDAFEKIARWTADFLLNLKGTLEEIQPFAAERPVDADTAWQTSKKRYIDNAQMVREMKKNRLRKIVRAFIPTLSGYLLFFYAMNNLKKTIKLSNVLIPLLIAVAFTVIVYVAYTLWQMFCCKRTYSKITKRQTARIIRSRTYFNHVGKYFRYNWVLMFNERMKQKREEKRSLLYRQKKELDYFRSVCGLMKLCCVEGSGSGQTAGRPGSIANMLQDDQHLELFQMSGRFPTIMLNGNRITAAFPFVKAIHLTSLVL